MTVSTLNTYSDDRSQKFQLHFEIVKFESKRIMLRKKTNFSMNLVEDLEERLYSNQIYCQHNKISPHMNCGTKYSRKNILNNGGCDKL